MIQIDLRDLTQAHIDEAAPFFGKCSYAGPCIIGTLIPADQRDHLDNGNDELGEDYPSNPGIGTLVKDGILVIPDEQLLLARNLQAAFDRKDRSAFATLIENLNDRLGLNLKVPA